MGQDSTELLRVAVFELYGTAESMAAPIKHTFPSLIQECGGGLRNLHFRETLRGTTIISQESLK